MMHKKVTDRLKSIEELLEEKKYDEIIDALGEIKKYLISPDDKAYYSLISVDVNIRRGNFEIDEPLKLALEYYKNSHDHEKFAKAKYLYGRLLIVRGKHFSAREELLESYAMYKRCDSIRYQALVLNVLGQISFQLGDLETSELYLKKCMGIYGDLQDSVNRYAIGCNLGSIYTYTGDLSKAIDNFTLIEPHVHHLSNQNIGIFYIQYSVPLALRGDIELAEKIIAKARLYLDEYAYDRGSYYIFRGRYHYLSGRPAEARKDQLKAQNLIQDIAPDSPSMSQIKRQLAETSLALNDTKTAQKLTNEALTIAENINERVEMAGCYRNLAILEACRGNWEQSRKWFKKALDLYRFVKARYELAVTQYMAANSGSFQGGERQALVYLASDYFESENVHGYIARINTALTGILTRQHPIPPGDKDQPLTIVTVNDEMKRLIAMAEHVAASDMSILLTGATGTGKDLFARYIHNYSGRPGRFVSINAAAIPDSMVESELFGHKRGAFTNADRDKVGLIEVAHNGTLYLNEIADSSKELQAKLLDVLETHQIRRLGETRERQVSFRLIAATNHDLDQLIHDGRFRIDLYHRLSEVPLSLPLLRDRLEDIGELLTYFLSGAGIEFDENHPDFTRLVKVLSQREWQGNVRQLEAEAKRLALLSGGDVSRMLELALRRKTTERDHLYNLLQQSGWNRRAVARQLGVSDTTIRRKIKKFGLSKGN
jgi:transcriptional regulator with PAS, ATPase and Fis domain